MEYSWKIVVFEEKKRVMRKFPLLPLPCTKPMDNKKSVWISRKFM